jgi:hypothetical protein
MKKVFVFALRKAFSGVKIFESHVRLRLPQALL